MESGPVASTSGAAGAAPLARDAHIRFITALNKPEHASTFEGVVTQHLRMSGVYWGYSALWILGAAHELPSGDIAAFVAACVAPSLLHAGGSAVPGHGYGGNVGHDANLLYTLSALQLLALCGRLADADGDRVSAFIVSLQGSDGSFRVSEYGETDTRATYCALQSLALLGRLGDVDVQAAVRFLLQCRNLDGGFGAVPGGESHAGQVFTCVAALAIADGYLRARAGEEEAASATAAVPPAGGGVKFPLQEIDVDLLGWWLAERQVDGGGLNGRPEKQADVCYSWWILSALHVLGRTHWINRSKLAGFIREAQDVEGGGIADRPGNMADVFHTFFGIAGLSLLGELEEAPWHGPVDPVYALPLSIVRDLRLPRTVLPALDGAVRAGS